MPETRSGPPKVDLSDLKIDQHEREDVAKRGSARIWLIVAVILIGAIAVGWSIFRSTPPAVETVIVRSLTQGQAATVLNASGYVTPRRRATIASKVTGQVVELYVDEGMAVETDQVLARLDDSDVRDEVTAAQANVEAADASVIELNVALRESTRTLERMKALFQKKMISQQEFDDAQAAFDSTKARLNATSKQADAIRARLQTARQSLENYTIRAPFAGIIVSKDAQIGEMVSPISAGGGYTRTGIATIVDMTSLEIEVDVNESYIARVQAGQKVEATLEAYPDWKIPATVRTVIPSADRQKATVKVRISFDTLDPKILPDMGIKVAFLDEAKESESDRVQLMVPRAAIRETDGRAVVMIVRQDRLEERAIKSGAGRGVDIEILAGLTDGDKIVSPILPVLKDGDRVTLK